MSRYAHHTIDVRNPDRIVAPRRVHVTSPRAAGAQSGRLLRQAITWFLVTVAVIAVTDLFGIDLFGVLVSLVRGVFGGLGLASPV